MGLPATVVRSGLDEARALVRAVSNATVRVALNALLERVDDSLQRSGGVLSDTEIRSRLQPLPSGIRATAVEKQIKEGRGVPDIIRDLSNDGAIIIDPLPTEEELRVWLDATTLDVCAGNTVDVAPGVYLQSEVRQLGDDVARRYIGRRIIDTRCETLPHATRGEEIEYGMQMRFHLEDDEGFLLGPGDMAITFSRFWLMLPRNLQAMLEGKSKMVRLRATAHTGAPIFHPGFTGYMAIETEYRGHDVFALYPGLRIGHACFMPVAGKVSRVYWERKDALFVGQGRRGSSERRSA